MPLFYTESVTLDYSDIEGAKRWWIEAFDCHVTKVPSDWDCPLPSDIALQLPGHDAPNNPPECQSRSGAGWIR
jgi:hypothetical protein